MKRLLAAPDFFLDIISSYPSQASSLANAIIETARQGGGNIPVTTRITPGGNATNAAVAAARLGLNTILAIVGGELQYRIAKLLISESNITIVHLGGDGLCVTTALETLEANIMISDKSCLSRIGLDNEITSRLVEMLESDYDACILANIAGWGDPERFAKKISHTGCKLLLLDPSDVRYKPTKAILGAFSNLARHAKTIIALNDSEALHLTGASNIRNAARKISEHTGALVCIHTPQQAYCAPHDISVQNPFYTSKPRLRTGLGDAWNAGLLYAILAVGANLKEALTYAHAVAACKAINAEPCTLRDVLEFMKGEEGRKW